MIFVDTGAWFARFVPDDPDHSLLETWFAGNDEPLVTSDYCVDETLTLLVARKRLRLSLEVGRGLFEQAVARLHFLTPDQIHRAWVLFQSQARVGWSFTDCTSKIVMDDLRIRTVAALDHHFRQLGNFSIVP